MKNIFVFILLFALATNQETYHIFNISSIQCSPYNGYGLFGVNFEESIPVPGSDKTFQLVLKSSDGSPSINAYCSFNGISEDITYDESYEVTSEESENLDETTETFLEDRTSEIDSSFENEATDIESRENMVDEAISAESSEENEIISEKDESSDELIDEAFESGTDSNEFLSETEKISEETLTETVETGNDSEESTNTVSEEQTDSDEKLKETEEADNDSEESTKSVSEEQSDSEESSNENDNSEEQEIDEAEAEEETLSGGLRRLSQINKKKKIKIVKKRRRLNDDEYYDNLFNDYGASCYFESPQYSGRYTIDSVTSNDENINVELYESGAIISDLIHCIDEEWAQSLLNLNISFRQVNSFEIDKEGNAQFYLYGLTTKNLDKFSFVLKIYPLINVGASSETIDANCASDETIEVPELGILPVLFICSFTSTEQVTSIEIVGSEVMAGFPTDKYLLNPVLTDERINNGELPNMTDPDVFGAAPTIIDIQEFNFENAQSEGTFEIIGNCNSENLKVGQSFEFPLAFPSGIVVIMTIKEINSGEITAECTLNTEVENQPLYFDQRTIILDGKELFTFPGFKTNSPASIIATEKSEEETSEETTETSADETVETATDETTETSSDEAIETLDNELAETSTDESAETIIDETTEASSDEASEILDDEAIETSSDETAEALNDETIETSTDETAEEATTNELAETLTDEAIEASTEEATTDELAETTADETAERSSDETSEILDDEREEVTDEISEKSETSITETTTEPQTDISLEDAELAANMTLSFRQVNSFEIDKEGNAQFYLYGFTTEELVKFSFALEIYLLINGEKSTETTEINCSNDETIEIPELGIAPVLFICSFTSTEQVTSIEIVSSEVMVGFPTDEYLLNPVLTDERINNGELPNMTDPDVLEAVPPIIDIQEFNFDNVEKEGTFEIIATLKEESSNLEEGQSFEISLAYPSYIDITITITKIDGLEITFECEINGEVDSQPLISEQKVIMLDGKELLVLPGFQTEEITTSGVVAPSEETSSQNGTSTEETTSEETSTEEISSETKTDESTGEETTSEETTSEESSTNEKSSTEEATTEETSTDETTGEETTTEETTSKEISTDETTGEETTTEEASLDEATSEETSTEGTTSEETTSEETTSEETTSEGTTTEETTTEGTTSEETTSEGTTTEETTSEETTSEGTTSEETTSEETTSEGTTSEETTTEGTTSEETTSEETTSEETTSEGTTTEETTSEETTSEETTSEETTSEETTSEETTSEETTSEESSSNSTATEEYSSDETSSEELSDTTTEEETSSDEVTTEETSSDTTINNETSSDTDTSSESDATDSTQPSTERTDEAESTSKEETNRPTFVIDEDVITIEDAKKLLNISLSFRQLKQFEYNSGAVSFIFIGLASQHISTGHTISILINLYLESGDMEEEARPAICTISSPVNPSEGQVVKAIYECKVENLEEVYTSLRFNNSDEIAGAPTDDEVALNPVLTDQAIENKEVIDGEKVKVPPTFVIEEEDHSECSSSGKLKIKGSLTEDTSIVTKFTIPLTYPEGVSLTCSFDINTLDCTLDRDITESLLIEQVMIKEGTKELFILPSFKIEDIKCRNGIIKEVEEKVNVDISFRQVSTIKKITKGFNFFFAAFVNNKLQAKTEIKMKIILLLANATEIEKNATCVLKEDVSPSNGSPIQGDFDCSISLTDEEDKSVGSNYELSVSPDNGDIGGCAELTEQEKSPRLTDLAIAESKEKGDDSLGKVLDFSLTENKEYKPPTFEVTSFNLSSCAETGKFKVKGTFSEDITEELTFNIPFSFPSSEIKCTVKNVTKDEEVEIKCKVQKGFRKVRSFVLEPRLIKKKCVEKLYIKGNKNIELNENAEFKCENFNTIKKQKAILRYKEAHYSFLQLSRPVTKTHRFFFMALRRRVTTRAFARFSIKIKVHVMRKSLRMLQDDLTLDLDDVEVECNVDQKSGDSASYGCSPSITINADPNEVEIDDEESLIVGAPDEIEVQTNPTIDLTELSNLDTIEKLPSVNITNITSLNCTYTGQFSIIGDLVDSSNQLSSFNKSKSFVVPFATPDSKGVCKINSLTDSNIELICENTEDFSPTQVLISSQVINDANGNPIFKIVNDKTAADLFGCATSENSTLPTADEEAENTGESSTDSTTSSDTTSTQGSGLYHRNTSSGGLSGGAIAGIVIACAAVLIAVCVLMGLVKKGALGARKRVAIPIDNSATVAQFNYAQGQN